MERTLVLKSSLTYGLCYYYLSVFVAKFYPFDIARWCCIASSSPYTGAFSNVIGPLRRRKSISSNRSASSDDISDPNYSSASSEAISHANNCRSMLMSEPEHFAGIMIPGGGSIPLTLTCLSNSGKYRVSMCCEKSCIPDFRELFEKIIKVVKEIEKK